MQEKFRPAIDHFKEIVEVSKRMVSASTILDIPLVVTEQVNYLGAIYDNKYDFVSFASRYHF